VRPRRVVRGCLASSWAWVGLRYPLLRARAPVPAPVRAWILAHPRAGNALFNLVRARVRGLWIRGARACPGLLHCSLCAPGEVGSFDKWTRSVSCARTWRTRLAAYHSLTKP